MNLGDHDLKEGGFRNGIRAPPIPRSRRGRDRCRGGDRRPAPVQDIARETPDLDHRAPRDVPLDRAGHTAGFRFIGVGDKPEFRAVVVAEISLLNSVTMCPVTDCPPSVHPARCRCNRHCCPLSGPPMGMQRGQRDLDIGREEEMRRNAACCRRTGTTKSARSGGEELVYRRLTGAPALERREPDPDEPDGLVVEERGEQPGRGSPNCRRIGGEPWERL